MKRNAITFSVLVLLLVAVAAGCTKGYGVGGREGEPAAVETAGVPPLPHHGAPTEHGAKTEHGAERHEGPTSPADPHGTPTEPGTATSHEASPTTPSVQEPARAGDPVTTTAGQSAPTSTH